MDGQEDLMSFHGCAPAVHGEKRLTMLAQRKGISLRLDDMKHVFCFLVEHLEVGNF